MPKALFDLSTINVDQVVTIFGGNNGNGIASAKSQPLVFEVAVKISPITFIGVFALSKMLVKLINGPCCVDDVFVLLIIR